MPPPISSGHLIEGHNTQPVDIEKALKGDYSAIPEKRNLQLEAQAHITVQAWIDEGGVAADVPLIPEISEFSYGSALTNELAGRMALSVAPVFSSLIEEGKRVAVTT